MADESPTMKDVMKRLPTGIEELDELLERGHERGEFHIFVSPPCTAPRWKDLVANIECRRPPDIMPEPGS